MAAQSPDPRSALTVTLVGGPTCVLEIGGLRILTDPTFDPPGDHPIGQRNLIKTTAPAVAPETVGHIDLVLLSHDQHPDNLDDEGRRLIKEIPLVLTTASAQERLGGTARELPLWRSESIPRPGGGELRVTGVPAQHGPSGSEHLTGEVRGFVLSGDDLPRVYVSGDNASLAVVRDVADHTGPIDVAIIFAGRARSPLMDAYLTFSAEQAAEAALTLGSPRVIAVHAEGWAHLTEDQEAVTQAFTRRAIADRLCRLVPGAPTPVVL